MIMSYFSVEEQPTKKRSLLLSYILVTLNIVLIIFSLFYPYSTKQIDSNIDLSDRIAAISNNLTGVSEELYSIQQELERRIEFVENLKKEAEIAENVISLSEEQINAVQTKLTKNLRQAVERTQLSQ